MSPGREHASTARERNLANHAPVSGQYPTVYGNPDHARNVISAVAIRDPVAIERYRTQAAASIEHHGGRYLARGGAVEALKGNRVPLMGVIVEFPDADTARAWYRSPDQARAPGVREEALDKNLILVEDVAPLPCTRLRPAR